MRRLIIDADGIIYQAAAALEEVIPYHDNDEFAAVPEFPQYVGIFVNPLAVWETFWREIESLANKYDAVVSVAITDSAKNFRLDIDPTYKGNRKHTRKPLAVKMVRDKLALMENVYFRPNLEADDVCGILATMPKHAKDERIIWSPDKDLLGIPGLHTGYGEDPDKVFEVSPQEASQFHLLQTVTGDATDGYPGIPGIGQVKANKWFDEHGWSWESVMLLAEKMGPEYTSEYMLRQARLAKILEHRWYDYRRKAPIMWVP